MEVSHPTDRQCIFESTYRRLRCKRKRLYFFIVEICHLHRYRDVRPFSDLQSDAGEVNQQDGSSPWIRSHWQDKQKMGGWDVPKATRWARRTIICQPARRIKLKLSMDPIPSQILRQKMGGTCPKPLVGRAPFTGYRIQSIEQLRTFPLHSWRHTYRAVRPNSCDSSSLLRY